MSGPNGISDGTAVVIGCGAVGCFTAYRLAAMGLSVTLIDQEGPGRGYRKLCGQRSARIR
ncbi:MAG: hypothetical protein Ct9H300mP11_01570 [Chloroflexota bacterium]|nr:MAG: hypothetical protein Ct9H300mP11_01570 [Chloroflexota bacterium]